MSQESPKSPPKPPVSKVKFFTLGLNLKMDKFKHGLEMIFKKWTGLQLAISYSDYETAIPDLVELTYEFFQESTVEIDELKNNLEAFIDEELDCELQDNSPGQVAIHICELYKQISSGSLEMYEKMVGEYGPVPVVEIDSSDSEMDTEEVQEPEKKYEPIIDEDGFELVQKGRRKR